MQTDPMNLWDTVDPSGNIVQLLHNREVRTETAKILSKKFHFTDSLLKRLGLQHELEGHEGCVNCLQWSKDGRILASGSDDTNVIIWDPFRKKKLSHIATRHRGNIFSVKFIGDGSLVVTGAGDCKVKVQMINGDTKQAPILDCSCHANRVKRLATAPDQPQLFWSASEDGIVLQHDMREPHECHVNSKVFVDLSQTHELKCIAVNPTKPQYIAVGANDAFVRMYDRRMMKLSKLKIMNSIDSSTWNLEPIEPGCVQYYSPGDLARDSNGLFISVTYISFNSSGTELLVNMGGDHVYLYDLNNSRKVDHLKIPDSLPKRKINPELYKPCCLKAENLNNINKGYHSKHPGKHNYKINENEKDCVCAYMERASRLFQRKWTGDIYAATRDYLHVIMHWPDYEKAYLGLIECLILLKWKEESLIWIEHYKSVFPAYQAATIKRLIDLLEGITFKPTESSESVHRLHQPKISDDEKELRETAIDYDFRYIGHCNTTTDIKEANFLGEDGAFICAGSDDGIIFVWDRKTTNVLTALVGDFSIVNCVQPHPSACYLASSGIDPVVKLWSPLPENVENPNIVEDPWLAIEENQKRIFMDPFETMLVSVGQHFRDSHSQTLDTIATCRTS